MRDKFSLHLFYLFIGLASSAFFIFYFKYNETIQLVSALLGCIYYVVWGIMHHAARERVSAHPPRAGRGEASRGNTAHIH